jgi:nicotinamidase-related amidase
MIHRSVWLLGSPILGAAAYVALAAAPSPSAAEPALGQGAAQQPAPAAFRYQRLDKNDAVVLLVDHQSGLISLVQDFSPGEFKNNVLALADIAKFFELPVVLTTSFEEGPNGPLVPELKQMFPDAAFVPRPGQINAWDNEDFVKAVRATGRKQLIIAGVVTDVCVAFPALSAIEAGYQVFVVTDASGTFNEAVRSAAWDRMSQAGAQLMNWFSVACELHRDWRNDVEGLGNLLSNHLPAYRNLITSYLAKTPQPAAAERK